MTKRYVLSYEDLQNLIHESITFFSDKVNDYMKKGRPVKFSDRTVWIAEFLDKGLKEMPIDDLLDKVDEAVSSFTGRSIDDIKEDLRKKEPEYFKKDKEIRDFMKTLDP